MVKGFAVAFCVVTAGCAGERLREADAAVATAAQGCQQQFPNPTGDFLNRARCNEPALRANLAAHGALGDLVNLYLARRAAVAAQIDNKQVTKEQAEVSIAETQRELTGEMLQRRRTNAAAYRDLMGTQQSNEPIQTSCNRFGNTVNCTTN